MNSSFQSLQPTTLLVRGWPETATVSFQGLQLPDVQALSAVGSGPHRAINQDQLIGDASRLALLALGDANQLPDGVTITLYRLDRDKGGNASSTPITGDTASKFQELIRNRDPYLLWIDTPTETMRHLRNDSPAIFNLLLNSLCSSHATRPLDPTTFEGDFKRTEFELLNGGSGYRSLSVPTDSNNEFHCIRTENGNVLLSISPSDSCVPLKSIQKASKDPSKYLDLTDPSCIAIYVLKDVMTSAATMVEKASQNLSDATTPLEQRQRLTFNEIETLERKHGWAREIKLRHEELFQKLSQMLDSIQEDGQDPFVAANGSHFKTARRELESLKTRLDTLCTRLDHTWDLAQEHRKEIGNARNEVLKTGGAALTMAAGSFAAIWSFVKQYPVGFSVAALTAIASFGYRYFSIGRRSATKEENPFDDSNDRHKT